MTIQDLADNTPIARDLQVVNPVIKDAGHAEIIDFIIGDRMKGLSDERV